MRQIVVFGTHRTLSDVSPRRRSRVPIVLLLIVVAAAACIWPAVARAEDGDAPRFAPSVRGGDPAERWREVVSVYPWDADTAIAIVRCESRGDESAVNETSGAQGLFQVLPQTWQRLANTIHGTWVSLLDGQVNTRTAFALYEAFNGWSPWASSRACWGGW